MSNITVRNRIYLLVAILLLGSVTQSIMGIVQMNRIGVEITEIAEQDIPLTRILTQVTVHQLEQAIELEKGLAHIGQSDLPTIGEKFTKLSHKVDAEIKEAEEMLARGIENAHSEEAKTKFAELLELMKKVEGEHAAYEKQGIEMFAELAAGNLDHAKELAHKAEAQQEKLDHQLIAALEELSQFTLLSAERDEQIGIQYMIWLAIGAIAVSLVVSTVVGRSVANPIGELTNSMDILAADNTDAEIPYTAAQSEIGRMARSVEVFREQAIEVKRLNALQGEADRKAAAERAKMLSDVAAQIEETVGEIAHHISDASVVVNSAAQTVTSNARQTASQSTAVASASEQASANVQTVASAAEELSASVSEIGRQVRHSTDTTSRAVIQIDSTNAQVQGLAEAANKIGEVVALISDIAEQTNLLALNATIEAARAGEAGKGFAVVASEVKSLAGQTAKATDEISGQVSEIQSATKDAVEAILDIGNVIGEISEISNNIAAAVEEQGDATTEIARNVEQAALGTQEVSGNVIEIAQAAEDTGEKANELLSASGQMSQDSNKLKEQVSELVAKVRAA